SREDMPPFASSLPPGVYGVVTRSYMDDEQGRLAECPTLRLGNFSYLAHRPHYSVSVILRTYLGANGPAEVYSVPRTVRIAHLLNAKYLDTCTEYGVLRSTDYRFLHGFTSLPST